MTRGQGITAVASERARVGEALRILVKEALTPGRAPGLQPAGAGLGATMGANALPQGGAKKPQTVDPTMGK